MAKITFRGKVETVNYADGSLYAVRIKVPELDRKHCDMAAFYGAYANSDQIGRAHV